MLFGKPIYLWKHFLNVARITFLSDYWSWHKNVKNLCSLEFLLITQLHWIKFLKITPLCVNYTYFHLGKEKSKRCTMENKISILNEYELILCNNMVDFLLTTSTRLLWKPTILKNGQKTISFLQTTISKPLGEG